MSGTACRCREEEDVVLLSCMITPVRGGDKDRGAALIQGGPAAVVGWEAVQDPMAPPTMPATNAAPAVWRPSMIVGRNPDPEPCAAIGVTTRAVIARGL